jgi:hypothetical protein
MTRRKDRKTGGGDAKFIEYFRFASGIRGSRTPDDSGAERSWQNDSGAG